jgi:hypothetical protein
VLQFDRREVGAGASAKEKEDAKARESKIYLDPTNSGIVYKIFDCEGGWKDVVFRFQFFRRRGAYT